MRGWRAGFGLYLVAPGWRWGWGKVGARLPWWPAEPQGESTDGTPGAVADAAEPELRKGAEGAALGIQMGTAQVTVRGLQGLREGAGGLADMEQNADSWL